MDALPKIPTVGLRCLACRKEIHHLTDRRGSEYGDRSASGVAICEHCGHIFQLVDGVAREVDRRKLLMHPQRDQIRARQAQVVAKMIG